MCLDTELLLLVCLMLHSGTKAFQDCPVKCSCTDGSTIVDCSNQGLREVPTSLPPSTITLILKNNSIAELDPNRMAAAPRVSHLDVSYNKLTNITKAIQKSLPVLTVANLSHNNINNLDVILCRLWPSLVNFDISHNQIKFLKSGFFIPCMVLQKLNLGWNRLTGKSLLAVRFINSLQHLDLSGNKMPILIANAFVGLPNLQSLRVTHLGTRMLLEDTFTNMRSLQSLDLSFNDFFELDPTPFYKLKALWVLNLEGITFLCACGLNTLKHWIVQNSIVLQGPVVCMVPKPLQNLDIRYTDMLQFCPPTTSPSNSVLNTKAPSICGSATPSSLRVTNITTDSAMLRWNTGSFHRLPSSLVLRNIGGVVNVQVIPIDLTTNYFRLIGLQSGVDFVACIKVDLCAFEECVLIHTIGDADRKTTLVAVTDDAPSSLSVAAAVSVSVAVTIIIFIGCFVAYMVYTKKLQILEKLQKGGYSPSSPVRNPQHTPNAVQPPVQSSATVRMSQVGANMADMPNDETLQVPSRMGRPESLYNNPSYADVRGENEIIWGVSRPPSSEVNAQRPAASLPIGYASISTEDISKPAPTVYADLLPEDRPRMVFKVGRLPSNGRRATAVLNEPEPWRKSVESVNLADVDLQVSDSENEGHYCHIKDCDIQNPPQSGLPNDNSPPLGGSIGTNIEKEREHVLGGKSGTPHWKNFVPASMFEADNYENAARGERVETAALYANVDP